MRTRTVELRRVRASDLTADGRNWRGHGEGQRGALDALLGRVGFVGAVIARDTPDGLVLVDGHLRAEAAGDAEIPVLVVDLDDAEAGEVLATYDPLAEAADTDWGALAALVADIDLPDAAAAIPAISDLPAMTETRWAPLGELSDNSDLAAKIEIRRALMHRFGPLRAGERIWMPFCGRGDIAAGMAAEWPAAAIDAVDTDTDACDEFAARHPGAEVAVMDAADWAPEAGAVHAAADIDPYRGPARALKRFLDAATWPDRGCAVAVTDAAGAARRRRLRVWDWDRMRTRPARRSEVAAEQRRLPDTIAGWMARHPRVAAAELVTADTARDGDVVYAAYVLAGPPAGPPADLDAEDRCPTCGRKR